MLLRLLALVVSLAAGVALGLAATVASLRDDPPFGAFRSGPWTAWPDTGTAAAEPYARALFARDGRIPLATAAGVRFIARADDAGRALEGRCTYEIGGATPAAQFWTMAVLDPHGGPRQGPDPRAGFTSAEVVRGADGGFLIVLSRQARPGNWLPTRGEGPLLLMLTFYETPLGTALVGSGPLPTLPSIIRTACP